MLRAGVECFECHRNKDPETHDILNDDKLVGQSLLVLGLAVSSSVMSDSLDSLDCNLSGSSVHGMPRQEYWSGLPSPSPGDLPYPGIKRGPTALEADSLPSEPGGKPWL